MVVWTEEMKVSGSKLGRQAERGEPGGRWSKYSWTWLFGQRSTVEME